MVLTLAVWIPRNTRQVAFRALDEAGIARTSQHVVSTAVVTGSPRGYYNRGHLVVVRGVLYVEKRLEAWS